MNNTVKTPRTFGDIARMRHGWDFGAKCSFCKQYASPRLRVWKYSTRHYVCAECVAKHLVHGPRRCGREWCDQRRAADGVFQQ